MISTVLASIVFASYAFTGTSEKRMTEKDNYFLLFQLRVNCTKYTVVILSNTYYSCKLSQHSKRYVIILNAYIHGIGTCGTFLF